ncbi:glycosyl transferase [bacterium]|nr:glycosyl transferase [bacterium]
MPPVARQRKIPDTTLMSDLGDIANLRVAIVHDELTRRGGAEAVLEELIRIVPQANVYALYAGRPQITVDGKTYPVTTSFLQRLPRWWRRRPARVLAFLPYAAEQLDLAAYDLVISSASAFAKGVVTRSNIPHVCYCHTPTRYAWDTSHQVLARTPRWQRGFGKMLLHFIRLSDYAAAQRVDHYIANSQWTQERIATYYQQPSAVVYPPIDTGFFTPTPGGQGSRDYFLCVGRLTPSKQFDQAIAVCEKLGLRLIIVGTGYDRRRLERLAGENTTLVGKVSRQELRDYYRNAKAVIQPGEEDFGMATAEALACGTPVIAYGVGGAREVIRHTETGLLYQQPTVEALAEAMRTFLAEPQAFSTGTLQQSVLRFSIAQFRRGIVRQLEQAIAPD